MKGAPRRMLQAMMKSDDFKGAVKSLPIPAAGKQWLKRFKGRASSPNTPSGEQQAAGEAERPLVFPAEFIAPYFAAKVDYSTAKAERLLGYAPRFDLAAGMAVTEKWARWARIIK